MTIDEAIQMFVEMKNDGVENVFVYVMDDKAIYESIQNHDEASERDATPQDVARKVAYRVCHERGGVAEWWWQDVEDDIDRVLTEEREKASLSTEAAE